MTPSLLQGLLEGVVFPGAQAVDGVFVARVVGVAVGQFDAAAGQKRPDAVFTLLAVDVFQVVVDRVERDELLAGLFGPLLEEGVEHDLPRLGVDTRGVGQDAVEIEQAGVHGFR